MFTVTTNNWQEPGGGGIITPVDSTKVIRGVGLKSIGSIPTSELLNLTDNSANTVLSIVGNTATGSCDIAVNKHKAVTISTTGTTNGLVVDSNQSLTLNSVTITTNGAMISTDKVKLNTLGNVVYGSVTAGGIAWASWTNVGNITLSPGKYKISGSSTVQTYGGAAFSGIAYIVLSTTSTSPNFSLDSVSDKWSFYIMSGVGGGQRVPLKVVSDITTISSTTVYYLLIYCNGSGNDQYFNGISLYAEQYY